MVTMIAEPYNMPDEMCRATQVGKALNGGDSG